MKTKIALLLALLLSGSSALAKVECENFEDGGYDGASAYNLAVTQALQLRSYGYHAALATVNGKFIGKHYSVCWWDKPFVIPYTKTYSKPPIPKR